MVGRDERGSGNDSARPREAFARYAALVTRELETEGCLEEDVVAADDAPPTAELQGLTTALWRAAHALSPVTPAGEKARAAAPGPYRAAAEAGESRYSGGAGPQLDRMG